MIQHYKIQTECITNKSTEATNYTQLEIKGKVIHKKMQSKHIETHIARTKCLRTLLFYDYNKNTLNEIGYG